MSRRGPPDPVPAAGWVSVAAAVGGGMDRKLAAKEGSLPGAASEFAWAVNDPDTARPRKTKARPRTTPPKGLVCFPESIGSPYSSSRKPDTSFLKSTLDERG